MILDKKERFTQAFEYLKSIGQAHKQRDVAEKMNANPANISHALRGREKVLTDKFLKRFNKAYNDMFNEDWLIFGNGEMLKTPSTNSQVIKNNSISGNGQLNNTMNGPININSNDVEFLRQLLDEKQKILDEKKEQLADAQKQINKLIAIIEELTKAKKKEIN